MAVLFSLASAVIFGVADFFGGLISRRAPVLLVVLWSEIAGFTLALAASPWLGESFLTWGDLGRSLGAGVAGVIGLVFLYRGFAEGRVSVVAPVSAIMTALVPVAAGVVAGERPSALAWAGVVVGIPAIWLVASSYPQAPGPGRAELGALAGVGFGLFFILIAATDHASGLWPLAAARFGALLVTGLVLWRRRLSPRPPPRTWGPMLWVGVGDMAANVAFFIAVRAGLIALVAVVVSLYPAFTVLLARFLLGERLGQSQVAGLGMAGVAVALIAAG